MFCCASADGIAKPRIPAESAARTRVRRNKPPKSNRVADPAVAEVAAPRTVFDIIGLELGEAVEFGELGPFVEIVEPHSVLSEDPVFNRAVGRPQRLEAVPFLHFLRDLN